MSEGEPQDKQETSRRMWDLQTARDHTHDPITRRREKLRNSPGAIPPRLEIELAYRARAVTDPATGDRSLAFVHLLSSKRRVAVNKLTW
ncbi:MAG: hypothetical protein Q7S44_01875 [bacterium]|nr:hypothetical protein [bacterium]